MTKPKQQQKLTKISVTLDAYAVELLNQLRERGIDPNEVLREGLRRASAEMDKTAKAIGKKFLTKGEGITIP